MAKHLVTMLVGVIVDADDCESATKKALVPFQFGILPNLVGAVSSGTRLADDGDTPEGFAERMKKIKI